MAISWMSCTVASLCCRWNLLRGVTYNSLWVLLCAALRLSEQGGIGLARMMVEQMQIRGHIDKAVKEGPSLEPTEVMKREND